MISPGDLGLSAVISPGDLGPCSVPEHKRKCRLLNEQFKSDIYEKITSDLPAMGHSPFRPMQNYIITVPRLESPNY